MMTARVITTILRLRRPIHPYIVVMTLVVIMGWGVIMRLTSGIVVIAGGLLALLLQPVR